MASATETFVVLQYNIMMRELWTRLRSPRLRRACTSNKMQDDNVDAIGKVRTK